MKKFLLGFIVSFGILYPTIIFAQQVFVTSRTEFLGFNPAAGLSLQEANAFEYKVYKDGSTNGVVVPIACVAGVPILCKTTDNIGTLFGAGASDGSSHTATISNALVLSSGDRGPETVTAVCNFLIGRNPGPPLNLRPIK